MCRYCSKILSGDANDCLHDLYIKVNGRKRFGIQTRIEILKGKIYLRTFLDDMYGDPIVEGKIEVQYCPKCGRKLVNES